MSEPVALTVKDMRDIYGVSKSSVYREIAAGRLQKVKYGATTLITGESARNWWNGILVASTSGIQSASTSASTSDAGICGEAPERLGKSKKKRRAASRGYEASRVG